MGCGIASAACPGPARGLGLRRGPAVVWAEAAGAAEAARRRQGPRAGGEWRCSWRHLWCGKLGLPPSTNRPPSQAQNRRRHATTRKSERGPQAGPLSTFFLPVGLADLLRGTLGRKTHRRQLEITDREPRPRPGLKPLNIRHFFGQRVEFFGTVRTVLTRFSAASPARSARPPPAPGTAASPGSPSASRFRHPTPNSSSTAPNSATPR